MRVILQRVSEASLSIEASIVSEISQGLLVLLGIEEKDTQEDISWLCRKITTMRIFPDEHKAMNLSVKDVGGEVLVVSQFTLHASVKKGNRPSFIKAAKPEVAIRLYEDFIKEMKTQLGKPIKTGVFGADMQVQLVNDGPVTISIDSKIKE